MIVHDDDVVGVHIGTFRVTPGLLSSVMDLDMQLSIDGDGLAMKVHV